MRLLLLLPPLFLFLACPAPRGGSGGGGGSADDDDAANDDDDTADDDDDAADDDDAVANVDPIDFSGAAPWYECDAVEIPEGAVVVPALENVGHSFGGENLRDVNIDADLPTGEWKQVALRFELSCPDGLRCDIWDRAGHVQVGLEPPGSEDQEWVEILRHITPYNRGMCQIVDVTELADVLQGPRTIRSHIDTWVGPGHDQGEGWRVDMDLVYIPGKAPANVEVVNVWGHRRVTVGDTSEEGSVDNVIAPRTVRLPADATRVTAHIVTTGHGFGFSGNCAEFCRMEHHVIVGGTTFKWNGWRGDCPNNPVSPQDGTWEYGRNGWCPGGVALGGTFDVTDYVTPGEDVEVDFTIRTDRGTEYNDVSGAEGAPFTRYSLKFYAEVD